MLHLPHVTRAPVPDDVPLSTRLERSAGRRRLREPAPVHRRGSLPGLINGELRGVNHRSRRADSTFCPDFHGAISTDDGATVLFHCGGYGRAHPVGARQIVCWLTHATDDQRLERLNDALCVGTGEVSADGLYIDVAELIWEPAPSAPR